LCFYIYTLDVPRVKTVLLTGDSRAVAQAIGRALGVDEIAAELLPEQKLEGVRTLLHQRRKLVMRLGKHAAATTSAIKSTTFASPRSFAVSSISLR
jgi:high-affinity K+ transport system ATPase subunit B